MKRVTLLLAALVLSVATLTGCSRFDREGSVDDMMEQFDLTRPQAECFVDDMVDEFGEDRVVSDQEATPEEAAKVLEILQGCLEQNEG